MDWIFVLLPVWMIGCLLLFAWSVSRAQASGDLGRLAEAIGQLRTAISDAVAPHVLRLNEWLVRRVG